MSTCQTAVALFQTEYIIVVAGLLEELDLLTDELEAGQYFDQLYTISFGDGLGHIGGNDGGYQCGILGHSAGSSLLSQDIFCDQHTGHVTGKCHILAGLGILGIHTQTVCIGIGCQNDVRILLLGQTQCVCKRLGILRVRVIQCGEVWIRILLFGNYIDVLKSQLGQDTSYRLVTGTA